MGVSGQAKILSLLAFSIDCYFLVVRIFPEYIYILSQSFRTSKYLKFIGEYPKFPDN